MERAPGAKVLLAIDDADRLDTASRRALTEGIGRVTAPGFFTLVTSLAPLDLPPKRSNHRALSGLAPDDAARLLEALGGARDGALSRRGEGPVEPLYVELLRRFRLDGAQSRAPARLLDLVDP